MIQESDFVRFKHESFRLRLKQLAKSTNQNAFDFVYVFFGGTGAVGGQGAIEIIQAYEFMSLSNSVKPKDRPFIIITGISEAEVETYTSKLFKVFGRHKFETVEDKDGSVLRLRHICGLEIQFYLLMAKPTFKNNIKNSVDKAKNKEEVVEILKQECNQMSSPFTDFLTTLKSNLNKSDDFKFKAVLSGIPIPSVATYHFEEIDRILESKGISAIDHDKSIERSIKIEILKGLAEDFGNIKRSLADEMLIAHTTSVGGMYQIVDGKPVIKLGYAHSSLGDLLKEKQFYANQLTIQYSRLGLKSLITASAIGIDYIYTGSNLPLSSGVSRKYRMASEEGKLPFPVEILQSKNESKLINKVFPAKKVQAFHPVLNDEGAKSSETENTFVKKGESIPSLKVDYALRSGENGVFSLDNAYALYLNMKIASQEELAHVLVYNAMLGDDNQKPWFDPDGLCYYTQTDNSSLVFSLLNNRREFRNYQISGFTPKAFQELGSSKHQGELHTIGLYMLMHRLKNLSPTAINDHITSKYRDAEVTEYVDRNTSVLLIEDIVNYGNDIQGLAQTFTEMLTLKTVEDLARFTGYFGELNGFIKTFFTHLFHVVQHTISTITSLGSPIIYTNKEGQDEIISGPYVAPADLLLSTNFSLVKYIENECEQFNLDKEDFFNWMVCNQGFIDLRGKATLNTAKSHKEGLFDQITEFDNVADFRKAVVYLQKRNNMTAEADQHFTTCGLVGFTGRIVGLKEKLDRFELSLGSNNGWKTLFPVDNNGNHPVVPGLIEAMRMYGEGLGKITGTEFLYPGYGYFEKLDH